MAEAHDRKEVHWEGDSHKILKAFPDDVQDVIGFQLDMVQQGETPVNFKPMTDLPRGVYEIRHEHNRVAYRAAYVAKFADAIYVLHCFTKDSNKTSQTDKDLITDRYRAVEERIKKQCKTAALEASGTISKTLLRKPRR